MEAGFLEESWKAGILRSAVTRASAMRRTGTRPRQAAPASDRPRLPLGGRGAAGSG